MGEQRVVVAMSGGVDSSVAAALLQEQGYDVIGITFRFWLCEEESSSVKSCCGIDGVKYARLAASKLGIPHYIIDCREEFESKVLQPAWKDYSHGKTPNPCVICNKEIKFGFLLEHARRLGADKIATGHYARVLTEGCDRPTLMRGNDPDKDQSYFLFSVAEQHLGSTLMPIGHLTKKEVRNIAQQIGLPTAKRPESQDACLGVGKGGFAEALRQRFNAEPKPGIIVDDQKNQIGTHNGIHHFTIGQRRGLGIAMGQRAYVLSIDADSAIVVVSTNAKFLESFGLMASGISWHVPLPKSKTSLEAEVQIRYQHKPIKAMIQPHPDGTAIVRFAKPQLAVTPGQAAVFYQNNEVIGGGWIERSINS